MSEEKPAERKRPFETYNGHVEKVEILTPRNKGIHFRLAPDRELKFKPGQFVQVFVPVDEDKIKRTSYSIASPPRDPHHFELCVTKVEGGRSSTFIHHLVEGDEVRVMGPLGKFTLPDNPLRDMVFVATGSGIAPLRSMIHYLLDHKSPRHLYLIFGNRYDGDVIYQSEFEETAKKYANFHVRFTLSRPEKWTGAKGYVQEQVQDFVPDLKDKDYYICGLSNMINSVEEKLITLGVPKDQIHYERYD